jgi:hypothetical protein
MRNHTMTTVMQRSLLTISCGIALSFAASSLASQVSGWWGGNWTCNIDGRPASMRWNVVDDVQTTCNEEYCTTSTSARWVGSFSDNGSAWVPLTDPDQDIQGGLYFRHADGNQWYLPSPTGNRTTGWTTWNGQRYPLSCWK